MVSYSWVRYLVPDLLVSFDSEHKHLVKELLSLDGVDPSKARWDSPSTPTD